MSPLSLAVFVLYLLASLAYGAIFRGRPAAGARLARPLLVVAIVAHVIYRISRAVEVGTLPMTTLPDALSTASLALALVYLYLELRQGTPMTGVFVLPIVALLALPGGIPIGNAPPPTDFLRSPWFALHTLSAVTSYCAFALAAVYGLLFLLLYHELKLGRFTLVYHRLPPLEQLGQMSIRSTVVGFVLLGVAMAIGGIWLARDLPGYFADPKVLATLAVWLFFGLPILAHYRWTRHGPLSVYLSVTGFALLMVSALVAVHFSSSFHRFH